MDSIWQDNIRVIVIDLLRNINKWVMDIITIEQTLQR